MRQSQKERDSEVGAVRYSIRRQGRGRGSEAQRGVYVIMIVGKASYSTRAAARRNVNVRWDGGMRDGKNRIPKR